MAVHIQVLAAPLATYITAGASEKAGEDDLSA